MVFRSDAAAVSVLKTSRRWWPAPPTRAEILNSWVGFGGQSVPLPQWGGLIPWFDPALFTLDLNGRQAVRRMKQANQCRLLMAALNWQYVNDGGYTYPVGNGIGTDFSQAWNTFKALLIENIQAGFNNLVMLAGEGQQPDGGQLGYPWLMANAPSLIALLKQPPDVTPYCVFCPGFEILGPGGNWSPDQLEQAVLLLRQAVGPSGYLALELGGGYDKWMEDGVAAWASPTGQALDLFLQEFPQPIDQNWDGCQQLASRALGPTARNIAGPNVGPWYLQTVTPRGPIVASAFEYNQYAWVRGQLTPQQALQQQTNLQSLGYTVF